MITVEFITAIENPSISNGLFYTYIITLYFFGSFIRRYRFYKKEKSIPIINKITTSLCQNKTS